MVKLYDSPVNEWFTVYSAIPPQRDECKANVESSGMMTSPIWMSYFSCRLAKAVLACSGYAWRKRHVAG